MAGRHRSPAARPALVIRRERLVEMVDARTDEAHLLTYGALAAGRRGRGHYIAVCGTDVLAHSPTAPHVPRVHDPRAENDGRPSMTWYRQPVGDDRDAHRGKLACGRVVTDCGISFAASAAVRPGRAGFADRGHTALGPWLTATRDAIAACECPAGCPSCVQSPKCGNGNDPLDKADAIEVLTIVLTALEASTHSKSRVER